MGILARLLGTEDKDSQLHRRTQRAESDAIHFQRLAMNYQMRLEYAVEKVRELRKELAEERSKTARLGFENRNL